MKLRTLALLACGLASAQARAASLRGETSRPATSTYAVGEAVELSFSATGVAEADTLEVTIEDAHDAIVASESIVVSPSGGDWSGKLVAFSDKLGFYRVYAKLATSGATIEKLGTRPAGYLTYVVVPDPAARVLYPMSQTVFGMQCGFSQEADFRPYLGVRWMHGPDYLNWRRLESYPAEMHDQRASDPKYPGAGYAPSAYGGKPWTVWALPSIFGYPTNWTTTPLPYQPGTEAYETAALSTGDPSGETWWPAYASEAAASYALNYSDSALDDLQIFQLTWEPVPDWGYKGSWPELARIYELAYAKLHEVNPNATVAGPTLLISQNAYLQFLDDALSAGLGKYLDAFSVHPYTWSYPPEAQADPSWQLGAREAIIAMDAVLAKHGLGSIPRYATEFGWHTDKDDGSGEDDPAKELMQAQGLVRQNLILLGEGYKAAISFYCADYFLAGQAGYGIYYNTTEPFTSFGANRIAPKPVAAAYAAMTFLLEGHRSVRDKVLDDLGDKILGYAYERGSDVVLALWTWDDVTRHVSIPVNVEQLTLFDWMGNPTSVATPNGALELDLSGDPVYAKGVSPALWGSGTEPPCGNGVKELGEQCDGDACCTDACTRVPDCSVPDAGNDSGAPDAGSTPDGGGKQPDAGESGAAGDGSSDSGCGCRVTTSSAARELPFAACLCVLGLALGRRRRRRIG